MNTPLEDTNARAIPHRQANCTLVDVTSVSVVGRLLPLFSDSRPFGSHSPSGNATPLPIPHPLFIFTCLFGGLAATYPTFISCHLLLES